MSLENQEDCNGPRRDREVGPASVRIGLGSTVLERKKDSCRGGQN